MISKWEIKSGCELISIAGVLDLSVADRLELAIAESGADVIVDLQKCALIDSIGISVILSAHQRFAAEGRRLVVCGPQDQVRRVLAVIGLLDRGLVFATLDEALDGVGRDLLGSEGWRTSSSDGQIRS